MERARERVGRRRSSRPAGTSEPTAVPPVEPAPVVPGRVLGAAPIVTGLVTTGEGTPLTAAVLTLVDAEGRQVGQANSAGDGSYEIPAPSSGSYLLICRSPVGGREPQASWVSVDGQPAQHYVVLTDTAESRA